MHAPTPLCIHGRVAWLFLLITLPSFSPQKGLLEGFLVPVIFISLLTVASMIYRQDLRLIIIKPITSIVAMVYNLAQNPLGDLQTANKTSSIRWVGEPYRQWDYY